MSVIQSLTLKYQDSCALGDIMPLYNVRFVDKSDEVKKTLVGLSKAALRESGKIIRKKLRQNVPLRSKRFKNHIGSWVMINYKTGQPTLQIGFYSWQRVRKRGKLPSHASPWWIEFGTKPHEIKSTKFMRYEDIIVGYHANHPGETASHVLRNTIQNSIGEIRAAQEKYLVEISGTIEKAKQKALNEDIEEDD